jgi:hypothetical protein
LCPAPGAQVRRDSSGFKANGDPGNPKMLLPLYDSCDYLHPSDAGYKAMADAIDLSLFSNKNRKRALLQHRATVAIWPMSAAGRTPYDDIDYPSLP